MGSAPVNGKNLTSPTNVKYLPTNHTALWDGFKPHKNQSAASAPHRLLIVDRAA